MVFELKRKKQASHGCCCSVVNDLKATPNNNNNLFESDRYCNIIREILDSRSINSARSCSTCCSATINSPSSGK